MFITFITLCPIKKDEVGGAYAYYGGQEVCKHSFGEET
jgi:hypothetical protein